MKKIGIDLCSFKKTHAGGKDEVAYNLLRGFTQLGVTDRIICFCHEELVEVVHGINPDLQIVVVPQMKKHRIKSLNRRMLGGYIINHVKKLDVGAMLFTNKDTPPVRFPVPDYFISHDTQVLSRRDFASELFKTYGKHFLLNARIKLYMDMFFRKKVISISKYDQEEIAKFFPWAKKKIVQIDNPIRFSEMLDRGESKYILGLNIQHPHKNAETLIRAYERIADQVPYDLMLVGRVGKIMQEKLNKIIQNTHVADRIHLPGFVPQAELDEIVRHTRLYVNPSLFEGFGMTAIELMGQKVPTIVSHNSASPSVTMGLCRYYYNATDDAELANVMMEELNSPTDAQQLDEIAAKVRKQYSYLRIAQIYWNELSRAAEGKA